MLLGVIGDSLGELLVMRQQEIEEESAGLGEDGRGLHQGIPLLGIGSSTRASGEIKLKDGTACRFAHGVPALSSSLHRSDDDSQNRSRLQELRSFWAFPQASIAVLERFVQALSTPPWYNENNTDW